MAFEIRNANYIEFNIVKVVQHSQIISQKE